MSRQQLVALAAPVVLIAMMVPIFQLLARAYGRKIGWHAGLTVYWLVWGAAYPLLLLGGEEILRLVKPVPFDPGALLLALIPVAFSVVGRFQFGVRYEKTTLWSGVALLATAFGNGLFEEILWRGTYLRLFPSDITLGILWPSVMFAMWRGTTRLDQCQARATWCG